MQVLHCKPPALSAGITTTVLSRKATWTPQCGRFRSSRVPERLEKKKSIILNRAMQSVAASAETVDDPSLYDRLEALATAATNLFPLFVISFAILGTMNPSSMTWLPPSLLSWTSGLSMLGMGLTLTFKDFQRALSNPKQILTGVTLQYTVMPTLAFIISRIAQLPIDMTIGLCVIGACPGGTASNIVTYLAKADVPLSVTMTTASTLGAVIMTPFLTSILLGTLVPVNAAGLLMSTLQIVLIPVLVGCALNQSFPKTMAKMAPFSAFGAVILIAVLCGRIMADNSASLLSAGWSLLCSVFALHGGGFLLGYLVSKAVGVKESAARTNSIEVGMQNSALGALLATQHFPMNPCAAVPCAISACTHSMLGSMLAAIWSRREPEDVIQEEKERRENNLARRKLEVRSWISRWRARTGVASGPIREWVTPEERDMYSSEQIEFLTRKRQAQVNIFSSTSSGKL
ncbi:hypothetical protein M9434_001464 [Picochlorum sp. BPE23]|nr:hypothetical protein M9434_001464 [Picochlorum sp. BPE23]